MRSSQRPPASQYRVAGFGYGFGLFGVELHYCGGVLWLTLLFGVSIRDHLYSSVASS